MNSALNSFSFAQVYIACLPVVKSFFACIIFFMNRLPAQPGRILPKRYAFLLHLLFLTAALFPQDQNLTPPQGTVIDVEELSLEQLLNAKVTVTTKSSLTTRDAPGVVTLITREEIDSSGARDLIDVLRLVPGIEFGIDVKGVSSLGIRGIWAIEGKILVLWDGLEMQEDLFGSTQIGNHYPVDLIERIEIIRGPGSAIHGGNAELGVIHIISRQASTLNGSLASFSIGHSTSTPSRFNGSLALSRSHKKAQIDLSVFAGRSIRSDQTFTDYMTDNPHHRFDMTDQSGITPLQLNLGLEYDGIKSRLFIDRYTVTDRTHYGINLPSAVPVAFSTILFDIQREFTLSRTLHLTPRYTFKRNVPWETREADYQPPVFQDKWTVRHTIACGLDFLPSDRISLKSGVEFFQNTGYADEQTFYRRDPTQKSLGFSNIALFSQGLFRFRPINVTIGARFDHNSETGTSFVPRAALTKTWGRFHAKILASMAFRSPNIENISRYASTPLAPEKTEVYELEGGMTLGESFAVSVNLFQITMKDPIVYAVDPILKVGAYRNETRLGSNGVELSGLLKTGPLTTRFSYSLYNAHRNEITDYRVIEDEHAFIGFPRHKITFNSTCSLKPNITLNLSGAYLSKRAIDNNISQVQSRDSQKLLVNAYLNIKPLFLPGLSVGLGIYDLGNSRYRFIQPYIGGSAPLPSLGREILLKISYSYE